MAKPGQKAKGRPPRRRGGTTKARSATSATAIRRARQAKQVVELRLSGLTVREIGPKVIPKLSKSEVQRMLDEELKDMKASQETKDQVRAMQLERLDVWLLGLYKRTKKGDEKAITAALKIEERRAKLRGTDAPEEKKLTILGQLGWVFDIMRDELVAALGEEVGQDAAQRVFRRVGAEGGPAADSEDLGD